MSRAELRNCREAHHIIAWGGCISPYRLHAQVCRPAPMPKGNAFQRLMRRVAAAWAEWVKPADDVGHWPDRGMW